jgi:hypothetical protein
MDLVMWWRGAKGTVVDRQSTCRHHMLRGVGDRNWRLAAVAVAVAALTRRVCGGTEDPRSRVAQAPFPKET